MKITRFEDIESWKLARELLKEIYRTTKNDKFTKDYGLNDQIQRASVSIIANISEGFDSVLINHLFVFLIILTDQHPKFNHFFILHSIKNTVPKVNSKFYTTNVKISKI